MKLFFMLLGLSISLSASANPAWYCIAENSLSCQEEKCSKTYVTSLDFIVREKSAKIFFNSIRATDLKPVISRKDKKISFFIEAKAKTVSGQQVEISSLGTLFSDQSFKAVVENTFYVGRCYPL